jgi:hypothetical protein
MGSSPAKSNGFLRVIKIHSMTVFRGEVKPSATCHKILWNTKDSLRYKRDSKIQWSFLAKFLPASLLGIHAATRAEICGG